VELFALLAHELGHIKQLKKEIPFLLYITSFVAFLIFVMQLGGLALGRPLTFFYTNFIFSLPFLIIRCFFIEFIAKVKHSAEFGADRIVVELGYGAEFKSVLKLMDAERREYLPLNSRRREFAKKLLHFLFSHYGTHPSSKERIEKIERQMKFFKPA
jgi:Zn-dependent protease with chaperone function